ncbi:MAG: energy-coupling factor transporter transmembrane component T [Lachnospiraceae bacterium]
MFKFHPLTKLYLLLLSNFLLFLHVDMRTEMLMTLLFLLPFWGYGRGKAALKLAIFYFSCILADVYLLPQLDGYAAVWVSMLVVSLRMLLPCIIAGTYAFTTTTVGEFVCAMRKIKVPENVIIPCMVIIRFFPTIKEDYRQICNALAYRGIASGKGALLLHPVQSLEYILMPLLMNGNNVAQDLSISSLTKGIGLPGKHTCMTELSMKKMDVLYMFVCLVPLILFVGGKA